MPLSLQSIFSKNLNILLYNHNEVTKIRNLTLIQCSLISLLLQSCPKEIFRSFVPVSCRTSLSAFNPEVFLNFCFMTLIFLNSSKQEYVELFSRSSLSLGFPDISKWLNSDHEWPEFLTSDVLSFSVCLVPRHVMSIYYISCDINYDHLVFPKYSYYIAPFSNILVRYIWKLLWNDSHPSPKFMLKH